MLEVLEDPLPALLLVGRAGGRAARLRRHVPAAALLPLSLFSRGDRGARKAESQWDGFFPNSFSEREMKATACGY